MLFKTENFSDEHRPKNDDYDADDNNNNTCINPVPPGHKDKATTKTVEDVDDQL